MDLLKPSLSSLVRMGVFLAFLTTHALLLHPDAAAQDQEEKLPTLSREYRGVWVASVENIDWPSKPGLSVPEQQKEILDILDKTQELRMNFVVLQIRTSCDAFYESPYEPWSYYLTGEQGKKPEPYYDPLVYWIEESHKRGLELHAWFNPFRAKASGASYQVADSHISKTKPELVKKYGNDKTSYLWLDPGEEEARAHSLRVFLDVVQRYDIDGVHIDDYFYPYPVDQIPFPDGPAWEKYLQGGGKGNRDDWRRESMNAFIEQLYTDIKKTKPHVKFGISPFGIWKPGYPASVAGMSQYDLLYADAKLWLNRGWCDYYTPQLYWSITARQQSFPALLAWWIGENEQSRHIAPGLYTGRIRNPSRGYTVDQLESQIYVARHMPGSHGTIHFSMKSLQRNSEGIADRLKENAYLEPAILPACDWIDSEPPAAPKASLDPSDASRLTVTAGSDESIRKWGIYRKVGDRWNVQIVGATSTTLPVQSGEAKPTKIAVTAFDGGGNESKPTFVEVPM